MVPPSSQLLLTDLSFLHRPYSLLYALFFTESVLNKSYPVVLGRKTLSYVVKYEGGTAETEFFVEGRKFLDENFEGLVTIYLSLLEPSTKVSI